MKKEKLYIVFTISLLMLLLIQSIKYNCLKSYKNVEENVPNIASEINNKILKIEDFIAVIQNEYVSINTLMNEKDNFKAILSFIGNVDELIKYVKYLEGKNILIKSYEIKRDEFLQCIMEVNA